MTPTRYSDILSGGSLDPLHVIHPDGSKAETIGEGEGGTILPQSLLCPAVASCEWGHHHRAGRRTDHACLSQPGVLKVGEKVNIHLPD